MRLSNSEGSDAANTAMALIRTAPIILRAFVFAVAMGVGPEAGGRCLVIGMARGVHCCALKRGGARSAPVVPRSVVGRLGHEEWHAECIVELPSVVEANILLEE